MTIVNSAVCFIAAPIAAVTAVSWLLTFTPWARFMPDVFFVPLFFLTFPLFGWSVFVLSVVRRPPGSRRTRWQPADPLKEIPRARVPLALAGAAAVASFVTAMPSLTGQPEYDKAKHRYFYDDHGTLVPATRTAYLHAVAAQNRLFLGVALVFLTAAVAITWDERNRRRRFPGPPIRWWHPVRPRPRIPVPGPVLVLAAAAGLAGLIACAVLIVSRVDAYNTSGPYLRAGHPVRGIALAGLSLVVLIAAMTGTILLLTWRLGLGKPVPAVPPGQDVLGAA